MSKRRKRHSPEQIVSKLRDAEMITTSIGRKVLWAICPIGIRASLCYFPNHYSHNTWTEIGGRPPEI